MPNSIQVHHKYPEASSEAGVSDVLSGSDWQFEAVHWPETLRKYPNLVFQFVKDKISSMNKDKNIHIANYSSCELKHMVGVFVQSLGSVVGLKLPIRAWKHIRDASFWGCLGVIVVSLDAIGHKFAASFWPKTAE